MDTDGSCDGQDPAISMTLYFSPAPRPWSLLIPAEIPAAGSPSRLVTQGISIFFLFSLFFLERVQVAIYKGPGWNLKSSLDLLSSPGTTCIYQYGQPSYVPTMLDPWFLAEPKCGWIFLRESAFPGCLGSWFGLVFFISRQKTASCWLHIQRTRGILS